MIAETIPYKFSLVQTNPIVGDFEYNFRKVQESYENTKKDNPDLVIYTECVTSGYPSEDLYLKKDFVETAMAWLPKYAALTENGPDLLVGTPYLNSIDGELYNAAVLFSNGRTHAVRFKHHLPNYNVFDEKRYFKSAPFQMPVPWKDINLGILICEDTWFPDVSEFLKKMGAHILISINGSPYVAGKSKTRVNDVGLARVTETGLPIIYTNQVGGQDSLVFDGGSFVVNPRLAVDNFAIQHYMLPLWKETHETLTFFRVLHNNLMYFALDINCAKMFNDPNFGRFEHEIDPLGEIYNALTVGLKDFIHKNGAKKVVFGKSGGADSALVGAIAADALGSENVHCILMPSKYTSDLSNSLAIDFANRVGITHDIVTIEPIQSAILGAMSHIFAGTEENVTEENTQARARGMVLMAYSNKFGHFVLSTGNKSEIAVGYATLYGDMCGAFNPIKDCYKTLVFKLLEWRNNNIPTLSKNRKLNIIPTEIITRPPSAELKPGQVDQDSLPPYEILDTVLAELIENHKSMPEIVNTLSLVNPNISLDDRKAIVLKIAKMVRGCEFKRQQACPGTKITAVAFNHRDRRYPIVCHYLG